MYSDPTGHTAWDQQYITDINDYNALMDCGVQWNEANARGDQAAMDAAHARGEAIRNIYRQGTNFVGSADGNTYVMGTNNSAVLYSKDAGIYEGMITNNGNSTAGLYIPQAITDVSTLLQGNASTGITSILNTVTGQTVGYYGTTVQTVTPAKPTNDIQETVNDVPLGVGLVAPLPPGTKIDLPTMPWEKPTPKIEPPGIGAGRATGIIAVLGMLLSLRGDSDQRPWDQFRENKEISEQTMEILRKLKNENKISFDEEDGQIVIYRSGNVNLNNLTPKEGDAPREGQNYRDYMIEKNTDTIGMSWSLTKPTGNYMKTTMEKVNATYSLIATFDGGKQGDHVSIIPARDGPWNNYSNLTEWASTKKYLNIQKLDTYDPNKVSGYTRILQKITTGPLGQPIPELPQK